MLNRSLVLLYYLFLAGCKPIAPMSYKSHNVPELVNTSDRKVEFIGVYDREQIPGEINIGYSILDSYSSSRLHIGNNAEYYGWKIKEVYIFEYGEFYDIIKNNMKAIDNDSSNINIEKKYFYRKLNSSKLIKKLTIEEIKEIIYPIVKENQATCILIDTAGSTVVMNRDDIPWLEDRIKYNSLYNCKRKDAPYEKFLHYNE